MRHPEHLLQTAVGKFVRTAVTMPHRFACFDRSENKGRRHLWESHRHIKKGEPDTELLVQGFPAIRVELKAPGNTPDDNQKEQGRQIIAAGHLWGWCSSVRGYGYVLEDHGVPLARNWEIQAAHHDALIAAAMAKQPAPKKASKPRARKPSPGQVKRAEAARGNFW